MFQKTGLQLKGNGNRCNNMFTVCAMLIRDVLRVLVKNTAHATLVRVF